MMQILLGVMKGLREGALHIDAVSRDREGHRGAGICSGRETEWHGWMASATASSPKPRTLEISCGWCIQNKEAEQTWSRPS